MTPAQLDALLDDMAGNADRPELAPGLITVNTDHWLGPLSGLGPTCKSLQDGMRYRDIQVHVASGHDTAVLSREASGDRGAPYRDLQAQLPARNACQG